MILDYKYDNRERKFAVSYINEQGAKSIYDFNVDKFKTYYYTPVGRFMSDTGAKCDIRWTEKPHKFDIKTYLMELDDKYKQKINQKVFPKLYTFDIETEFVPGVKPEPELAPLPITTIQITSPNLNTIILGTKALDEAGIKEVETNISEYLDTVPFYETMGIPKPSFKYVKFNTEEEMLRYFLQNIVSKVAVLAGWNCILFDWNYIYNRIRNNYPGLSINMASCKRTTSLKNYVDKKGMKISLPMPDHTLILDMMQVIDENDVAVMPIKESLSLDYIARESIGAHKIEYSGSLQDLYKNDYGKYVYYGAIDSILVQMIDRKFKTLNNIYLESLYCNEKVGKCFSKIQLTESLVFNDFYSHGIKIVPEERGDVDRGRLIGAYVKIPMKGLHNYVCCNDFASLYPSTIITCNLSFENWVGAFYDTDKLTPYLRDPHYIVIGGLVYKNAGTIDKPKLGSFVNKLLDEEKLEKYRKDPNYFVSVNGHVYRNDRDYTFRRIQSTLKATRDISKYLAKDLDATVMLDIHNILKTGKCKNQTYADECVKVMKEMGMTITCSGDLLKMKKSELEDFSTRLQAEIVYYVCNEQTMKLLGNSMYGGCSHASFYWYNMGLANDITGEARNLTHMMEHHIPGFWKDNWLKMKDLHKMLGREVDEVKAKQILGTVPYVTAEQDPDAFNERSWVYAAYGDTDSLYLCYQYLMETLKDYDTMTDDERLQWLVDLNTKFFDQHNKEFIADYYEKRHVKSVHKFELETINKSGIWLDVKKRYAQVLLWKDGKFFPKDELPIKTKGLEMIKSQYPSLSRKILKRAVQFLLTNSDDKYIVQKINMEVQKMKQEWMTADIEDICENVNINGYTTYVINKEDGVDFANHASFGVKSLANYNEIIRKNNLPDDMIYGGKLKLYIVKGTNDKNRVGFAFMSGSYPKWAEKYAPVNRHAMFQKYVLDPLNRITDAANLPKLNVDGSIQISLF